MFAINNRFKLDMNYSNVNNGAYEYECDPNNGVVFSPYTISVIRLNKSTKLVQIEISVTAFIRKVVAQIWH